MRDLNFITTLVRCNTAYSVRVFSHSIYDLFYVCYLRVASAAWCAQVVWACVCWDTQRHASNNNIVAGESGSLARRYARPTRDHNANVARTHTRLAHAHAPHRQDNTLDIILKPLIESTQ